MNRKLQRKKSGAEKGVASPCVGICRINEQSGLCEGCLRTMDEIANWKDSDEAVKKAILEQLRKRKAAGRDKRQD